MTNKTKETFGKRKTLDLFSIILMSVGIFAVLLALWVEINDSKSWDSVYLTFGGIILFGSALYNWSKNGK